MRVCLCTHACANQYSQAEWLRSSSLSCPQVSLWGKAQGIHGELGRGSFMQRKWLALKPHDQEERGRVGIWAWKGCLAGAVCDALGWSKNASLQGLARA